MRLDAPLTESVPKVAMLPFSVVDVAVPNVPTPLTVSVPRDAVLALMFVLVAPALKVARPPKVETPVLLNESDWIPPLKVEVETLVMVSAFAVVVPAWKVPTTVDEACDTKPFVMVSKLLKMLVPENVLLLARRVDDAAVIVFESPRLKVVPFTVTLEFCNWLLPMVVVETKRVPSKASKVPWVKEVALVPPLAMPSAEESVSDPIVAVLALMFVLVAPALKVAREPKVATPVLLKVAVWSPPLKVEVAGEPTVIAPLTPLMANDATDDVAVAVLVAMYSVFEMDRIVQMVELDVVSVSASCGPVLELTVRAKNGVVVPIPTRVLKVFLPEKVLESVRRVEDALPTVMDPPRETLEPLMVTDEFASSELPIEVEATAWWLASVVMME